jgi:hypothetical protein
LKSWGNCFNGAITQDPTPDSSKSRPEALRDRTKEFAIRAVRLFRGDQPLASGYPSEAAEIEALGLEAPGN